MVIEEDRRKKYTIRTETFAERGIVEEQVFFKNILNSLTGARYQELKRQKWMPDWMPNFITPQEIDFTILRDIPIQKAVGLSYENMDLDSNQKEVKLLIGDYINHFGIQTQVPKYVCLKDLRTHVYINGTKLHDSMVNSPKAY